MRPHSPCPEVQELVRFLSGQLPPEEMERLVRHLAHCGSCARSLPAVPPEDDPHGARDAGGLRQWFGQLIGPDPDVEEGREETLEVLPPRHAGDLGHLGHYRILRVLGSGGMGVVFQAEDTHLQRPVALKVMRPALAASTSARQRFLREALAAAAIKYDHVVTIYEADEDRGIPYLAMELLEGEPLDARLERAGRLQLVEVLRIGREIALGLDAAHQRGLIHRDIKPANLWLEAPEGRVKLLDFGLVHAGGEQSRLTGQGFLVGTPAYMSPEQINGDPVDPRSDLFSLGCVLYRMATGEPPFQGANAIALLLHRRDAQPRPPREVNREVPAALSGLILRLLSRDPADRPPTAAAVVEALRALEEHSAKETGRSPATAHRHRRPLVSLAVLLVGVLALAAGLALRTRQDPRKVADSGRGARPQIEEVVARLKERNPGFDGMLTPTIREQVVIGLELSADKLTDLAPLRALTGLTALSCAGSAPGKSKLADLSPLEGLPLESFTCSFTRVADLRPLRKMPLKYLNCYETPVEDLMPLKGLRLNYLNCTGTRVKSLSPLAGMPLETLICPGTKVSDLAPLKGLPLVSLVCGGTPVKDLSPLKGMLRLKALSCRGTKVSDLSALQGMRLDSLDCAWCEEILDLSPLKGMPLRILGCHRIGVADLSPLKDTSLTWLDLGSTNVADLSPLQGLPLTSLDFTRTKVKDLTPLRASKSLVTINGKPAAQFWQAVDAGRPLQRP